jgi:hypothetical protein
MLPPTDDTTLNQQSTTTSNNDLIEYSSIENLSADLELLINNPKLSDVCLLIGKELKPFYAHKIFLIQRSLYFHTMFISSGLSEATTTDVTSTISIDSFEPGVFQKVLRYLYCGKVQFEQSMNTDATNILAAADYFQCDELKAFCVQHLQQLISEETALDLLQVASLFRCTSLIDTCFDYLSCNTQEVLNSEAFTQLDGHTLQTVLESEYLSIDEIQVFTALCKWAIMRMYEEIRDTAHLKDEKEQKEDDEFVKKMFIRVANAKLRKRSSLSQLAFISRDHNNKMDSSVMPDVQIKKFNGGYEAFLSNMGKALSQGKYKEKFKESIADHISIIRFPLMTAELLTNMVEPLEVVPDKLLLEAYRFICATNVTGNTNNKSSNRNGASSPILVVTPTKSPLDSIRCQKRRGVNNIEFEASKILSDEMKRILAKWCEVGPNNRDKKMKRWVVGYQATRDGFNCSAFHKLIDNKGPSVTICRTTDGYIFGGYNSQSWTSNNCWKAATDTFLFSLVNPFNDGPRKLKVKNSQRAVYNHQSFGPTYGGGGGMSYFDPYDMMIDSSMKHGHLNVGNAYATFRGGWRSDEAQKSLAGSLNSWTLNECEVYLLQ